MGLNIFSGSKTLFFPGCTLKSKLPDILENYRAILKDLGIKFVELDIGCCGFAAKINGYSEENKELVDKTKKILEENKINQIITTDPYCLNQFKEEYGIEVLHISEVIVKHKNKIARKRYKKANYHDPPYLSRKDKIINEPRSCLKSAGYILYSLKQEKKGVFCCGTGIKNNSPKLADKICKERLAQFTENTIITTCPHSYILLSENKKPNQKILEFSEAFLED